MANHVWSVLCKQAIVDKYTGELVLINMVEGLDVTAKRAQEDADPEELLSSWAVVPADLVVVTLLTRSDPAIEEQVKLRVRFVAPDGEEYKEEMIKEASLAEFPRMRAIMKMKNIPLKGEGWHWLKVDLEESADKWSNAASLPLQVSIKIDE